MILCMMCGLSSAVSARPIEQTDETGMTAITSPFRSAPAETGLEQSGISGAAALASPFRNAPAETVVIQSEQRYSFEFRNDPLDLALYRISHTTGADIIYESRLTEGVMVSAVFREQPLGAILEDLLRPSGLEARRIRTGMYVVRYSLRRSMEPLASVTGTGDGIENSAGRLTGNPGIRSEDRVQTRRDPIPLRKRPLFWVN